MSKLKEKINNLLDEDRYEAKKMQAPNGSLRSSADVAVELNLTRQRVNEITKSAMNKVYDNLKKTIKDETPFQIFMIMVYMFNALENEKAIQVIWKSLDSKNQKDIKDDVAKTYPQFTEMGKYSFLK